MAIELSVPLLAHLFGVGSDRVAKPSENLHTSPVRSASMLGSLWRGTRPTRAMSGRGAQSHDGQSRGYQVSVRQDGCRSSRPLPANADKLQWQIRAWLIPHLEASSDFALLDFAMRRGAGRKALTGRFIDAALPYLTWSTPATYAAQLASAELPMP